MGEAVGSGHARPARIIHIVSELQLALGIFVVKLLLQLLLDDLPALFRVGDDAAGAILHPRGQDGKVPGAGKQEERAVTEEAGVPVFQIVAREEFTLEIYKMFIAHLLSPGVSFA